MGPCAFASPAATSHWSYAAPRARQRLLDFRSRLDTHLDCAEPESLAAVIAGTRTTSDVDPYGQVPHWLFAFDALGATAFRALATLAADRPATQTLDEERRPGVAYRPRLTAVVLDTVRLWPTTLVILRQTTAATDWSGLELPPRTTLVVVSSFFHRDASRMPAAHRLDLESWLDGTFDLDPGIIPFSAGPVRCPGRDLVAFTGATLLASILERHDVASATPRLDASGLPNELDHFRIELGMEPRSRAIASPPAPRARE